MLSHFSRVWLPPYWLQPNRRLCPWDSPGKNTGVGHHILLQGIFLIQGSNPMSPALAGVFFTTSTTWEALLVGKKNLWENCRRCKSWQFDPWAEKLPWGSKGQPTPIFVPGKFHGQRSLAGYSPWGGKELDMTEQHQQQAQTEVHCANRIQRRRILSHQRTIVWVIIPWSTVQRLWSLTLRSLAY